MPSETKEAFPELKQAFDAQESHVNQCQACAFRMPCADGARLQQAIIDLGRAELHRVAGKR